MPTPLPSQEDLKQLAHRIWMPAVAGAVGGGGLSGYLSAKAPTEGGESSGQRRARILRNALVGTALGAGAGAATEEGARALYQPYFGDAGKKPAIADRAIGSASSFAGRHAFGLSATAGGLGWVGRNHKAHQNAALDAILQRMGPDFSLPANGKLDPMTNRDKLRSNLRFNPANVASVEGSLLDASKSTVSNPEMDRFFMQGPEAEIMGGRHHARDIINEAGFKNQDDPTIAELAKQILLGKKPTGKAMSEGAEESQHALHTFLNNRKGIVNGTLAKGVSKLVGEAPIETGLGEHAFEVGKIPELYRRLSRPSFPARRVPVAVQLALLGGGVYAADRVQKRLMGQ